MGVRLKQRPPRKGDPEWGAQCLQCGGPKAPQALTCMECRRRNAKSRQERWQIWAAKNREHLAERQRTTYASDPGKRAEHLARLAAWRAANPERVKATIRRAKQRRRGMTRLDRGGESGWSNLTGSCASCNFAKTARPLLRFLLETR